MVDWQSARSGGTPIDFEAGGTEVATVLSGGSLQFDREDNLLVGGSDFFGSGVADYFALLPGPVVSGDPRDFDPDTEATSFYVLSHNEIRREFYANEPFALDFPPNIDNTRVYVYLPVLAGDLDGDDDVDFDDIGPMVLGLNDPQGYEGQFGLQPHVRGDIDGDGDLDFDDVAPFVGLLDADPSIARRPAAALQPAPVPEPSSFALALIICAAGVLKVVLALRVREINSSFDTAAPIESSLSPASVPPSVSLSQEIWSAITDCRRSRSARWFVGTALGSSSRPAKYRRCLPSR
jgi:hypothetical protein